MKNTILLSALVFVLLVTSCGPAAEDRQIMHQRAKIFQDSIANIIRSTMAEAEAPGPNAVAAPAPTSQAAPTATSAK